jgi:pimeloyl-ACP methyl ester carboxylesterase
MNYTNGNGARIYFETMGPEDGIPALLIQGFSAQMIGWRDGFCQKLVERGMRVIRFDNRDVGLSEKFGGAQDLDGGYTLADMAADSFGVLDELDLFSAHIVGQSMGGMIAQIMADTRPERVRSLSLIYTSPGLEQRHFVPPIDGASTAPGPAHLARAQAIEAYVAQERLCQSPGYAFNEAWIRKLGGLCYDRCHAPEGNARQWRAMMRAPKSFTDHERLAMPVAVIHGRDDGLIKVSAGLELGAKIARSELHLYPGMGHEIVEPLWDEFATIIQRTALRNP